MQFIKRNKLIEILARISKDELHINDVKWILDTYGDTYYMANGNYVKKKKYRK